jgi:uncharacterized repeat protein (TIGR01451 family)
MQLKHGFVGMSLVLVAAGSFSAASPGAAGGRPDIVVDVVALKEVIQRDASGRETVELRQADSTSPGDTLVYRIVYRNQGSAPAHDAQVVDPIPAGTQLVPGSWEVRGGEFTVSADGGKSFEPYPIRRAVKQEAGGTVMKEIGLSEYTHVRWTTKETLPPGAERTTAFKVTVR